MTKKILALLLSVVMAFCLAACSGPHGREDEQVTPQAEKNGQVAVLFTSDIHCAVLASNDYVLFSNGDGFTFFDGAEIVLEQGKLDNQMLIDYITDVLGGDISTGYTDLTGQGRITVTE